MDRFELVEGRTVLLRVSETQYRPAVVVKVWSLETANLVVFLDGSNDNVLGLDQLGISREVGCVGWATSRRRGEGLGQWITPQELVSIRASEA